MLQRRAAGVALGQFAAYGGVSLRRLLTTEDALNIQPRLPESLQHHPPFGPSVQPQPWPHRGQEGTTMDRDQYLIVAETDYLCALSDYLGFNEMDGSLSRLLSRTRELGGLEKLHEAEHIERHAPSKERIAKAKAKRTKKSKSKPKRKAKARK